MDVKKFFVIFLISVTLTISLGNVALAEKNVTEDNFVEIIKPAPIDADSTAGGKVVTIAQKVLGLIQFVAWAVAIGMALIIGIKYISQGAGVKADIKTTFMPYLIGAVCVGAATTIAEFALNIANVAENV